MAACSLSMMGPTPPADPKPTRRPRRDPRAPHLSVREQQRRLRQQTRSLCRAKSPAAEQDWGG